MSSEDKTSAQFAPASTSVSVSWNVIPKKAWWILALMTLDHVLGVLDRNAVSVLKTTLKGVFHIDDSQYGLLVTAFMVPYAICYVICGRMVDRWGSRATLTGFVFIWSVATIGAGLSHGFNELLGWRFLLGAAEAGLLPATMVALVTWFPRDRLATVYALRSPLQAVGPIISAPLIATLALAYGWRSAFIVPGAIGLTFAVMWWYADRSPPRYAMNAASNEPKESSRFLDLLRHPLLWGILLARLVSDSVWFFFQYWQAGYLQEVLGLSLREVGQLLWIPPLLNALLAIVTGTISDRLIRRGWAAPRSRIRVMQAVALLGPLIAVMAVVESPAIFIVLLTTTYLMSYTWLYLSNILLADLFPKGSIGAVVGVVQCVGTVGAAGFNALVGPVIEGYGYVPVFLVCAFLHPAAALVLQYFYRDQLRRPAGAPGPTTRQAA